VIADPAVQKKSVMLAQASIHFADGNRDVVTGT
jgi:hypothetical protein